MLVVGGVLLLDDAVDARRRRRGRCGRSRWRRRRSALSTVAAAAAVAVRGDEPGERRRRRAAARRRSARDVAVEVVGQRRERRARRRGRCRASRPGRRRRLGHELQRRRRRPGRARGGRRRRRARRESSRAVASTWPTSGTPGDAVQHLRSRRPHARALARGEDDDGEAGVGHASILRLMRNAVSAGSPGRYAPQDSLSSGHHEPSPATSGLVALLGSPLLSACFPSPVRVGRQGAHGERLARRRPRSLSRKRLMSPSRATTRPTSGHARRLLVASTGLSFTAPVTSSVARSRTPPRTSTGRRGRPVTLDVATRDEGSDARRLRRRLDRIR